MGGRALYHTTRALYKGGKKGGSKQRKGKRGEEELEEEDEDLPAAEVPDIEALCNSKQLKRIESLTQEFSRMRGGQVSAEMFNHLQVKAHGERVGILEVAQIVMKGSKFNVSVFDPELASPTASAIREAGLGLNPSVEGNNVIVSVNKPSKEAREALVKSLNQVSEKAKQDVRGVRKTILDKLKKLRKTASEDELARLTRQVESYTEKNLTKIGEMLGEKTKHIL